MTEMMEESDHTPSIWAERLEKLQHLLVCAPIPTGQVMHDDVLEVEVPDRHLVGITMRHFERLGHTPLPDAIEGIEQLGGLSGTNPDQSFDLLVVGRHLPQDVGTAFFQMELVVHPIRRPGHPLRVGGQSQSLIGAGCRLGELPVQATHGCGGLPPGHFLATDCENKRIKYQIGPSEPLP